MKEIIFSSHCLSLIMHTCYKRVAQMVRLACSLSLGTTKMLLQAT